MKKLIQLCMVALAMMLGAAVQGQQAEGPAAADSAAQTTASTAPKASAEILSDTMGVDFGPYLSRIRADIQHNWTPLIPANANGSPLKKGIVGIRITILPDGRIGSMKIETSSRDVDLDKAAWFAIASEGQFPALPQAFHGPLLELRLGFFYNTPPAVNAGDPAH
jgi:TonB family protein